MELSEPVQAAVAEAAGLIQSLIGKIRGWLAPHGWSECGSREGGNECNLISRPLGERMGCVMMRIGEYLCGSLLVVLMLPVLRYRLFRCPL